MAQRRIDHYISSSSAKRRKVKAEHCFFCVRHLQERTDFSNHLLSSEACCAMYCRSLRCRTLDDVMVLVYTCIYCDLPANRKLRFHLNRSNQCLENYKKHFKCNTISDVLEAVKRIKVRSQKSRQSDRRKLENEAQKQRKKLEARLIPMDVHINEFKSKTAFGNYYKCVRCEAFNSSCNAEKIPIDEIEPHNQRKIKRTFESYYQCKGDSCSIHEQNVWQPEIEILKIQDPHKTTFYPVLENAQLQTVVDDDNDSNVQEEALDALNDAFPPEQGPIEPVDPAEEALDALIVAFPPDENHTADERENEPAPEEHYELVENRYVTVFVPNSGTATANIGNISKRKLDIKEVLYKGHTFNEINLSKLYQNQVQKFKTANDFCIGEIINDAERLIRIKNGFSSENRIRGSQKYKTRLEEDFKFRIQQLGHLFLKIEIELQDDSEDTVATCLLQQDHIISYVLEGTGGNVMQRKYYVHNHSSQENCVPQNCLKMPLKNFLAAGGFDKQLLKNKFVPTHVLMSATKMNELLNLVKMSSSDLCAEDYFFELRFPLDGRIIIEGAIWPLSFKNYNKELAKASHINISEMDNDIKQDMINILERNILRTTSKLHLQNSLGIAEAQSENIKQTAEALLLNYDRMLEFPSLISLWKDKVKSAENNYPTTRFKTIIKDLLMNLADYGKSLLRVQEFLENLEEEHFSNVIVDGEMLFMTFDQDEELVFKIDEDFTRFLNMWPNSPIYGAYHYAMSRNNDSTGGILLKKQFIRESFTASYSPMLMAAFQNTKVMVSPIFGNTDWTKESWSHPVMESNLTMADHQEVSLAELVANTEPRKVRMNASQKIQYVDPRPNVTQCFKRVDQENEVTWKAEDGGNHFFELVPNVITRFFSRRNGSSLVLAEVACYYEYSGLERSLELVTTYRDKVMTIEDTNILSLAGKETYPKYLLCANGDVLEFTKGKKILRIPDIDKSSPSYKYSQVLLFQDLQHLSIEDLNEETVETLYSRRLKPEELYHPIDNPLVSEHNMRLVLLNF